jgi:hypothetical protein
MLQPSDNVAGVFYVVAKVDELAVVPDLDRTNNTAVGSQQLGINPDLALQTLSATFANQVLTVTAHVCNLGTMPSPGAPIAVRFSTDSVYDATDLFALGLGTALSPGACTDLVGTRTLQPSDNIAGVFYVVAKVDELAVAPDLDRTNNTAAAPLQVQINPDLTVEPLTATFANQLLTVTARVCNVGTMPSMFNTLAVRLSSNTTYEMSDTFALGVGTPYLAPGACADVSGSRTFQLSDNVSGGFYVVMKLDELAQFPDLDRNNNTAIASNPVFILPDPALETLTATFANQVLNVSARICNFGTMPATVTPEVRLSFSAVYDQINGRLMPGLFSGAFLMPGACADLVGSRAVSEYEGLFGSWYVAANVNPNYSFPDSNPANNVVVAAQQVHILPDLSVQSVSASHASGAISVTARVCNVGTMATIFTGALDVRLSTDGTWDTADMPLSSPTFPPVPYLTPGQCVDVTGNQTSYGEPGVFSVVVKVDPNDWYPDISRTNNAAASPALTFSPDLALQTMSAALTGSEAGPLVIFTVRVCNLGTARNGLDPISLKVSADTTWDASDVSLSTQAAVNGISPGACWDVPGSALADTVHGSLYVLGQVQPPGDLDLSNNTVLGPLIDFP